MQTNTIMNSLKRKIWVLAVALLGVGQLHAQYVTTHAKSAIPGQQRGLYYALPRTVLQFDFVIEETHYYVGPYSEYADFVGATDIILKDSKVYRIVDVTMRPVAEADPNATFFIAMNNKKGETIDVCLTSQGILEGVGIEPQHREETPLSPMVKPNPEVDEVSFKYQYGATAMKEEEQLARAAAEMVNKVREEKIKLLTGYQETAFNRDTYSQMYADLDAMEQEYLSLFVGKKVSNTYVNTVYVTPSKEVPLQTIAKFSPQFGFSAGTAGAGEVITVQLLSLQTTGSINQLSPSAVESLSHENKLFYRIPETANVKVSLGANKVLFETRETIAQLGAFMLAPLGKTKLAFDPCTGQLISFGLE